MKSVFADTSYYIASVSTNDAWHKRATDFAGTYRDLIITTEYVLVELGSHLCTPPRRRILSILVSAIESDAKTVIIPASSELFRTGLQYFNARDDKSWSLTDCISFVVMAGHSITDALTSDHHFEQAGFKALLRG